MSYFKMLFCAFFALSVAGTSARAETQSAEEKSKAETVAPRSPPGGGGGRGGGESRPAPTRSEPSRPAPTREAPPRNDPPRQAPPVRDNPPPVRNNPPPVRNNPPPVRENPPPVRTNPPPVRTNPPPVTKPVETKPPVDNRRPPVVNPPVTKPPVDNRRPPVVNPPGLKPIPPKPPVTRPPLSVRPKPNPGTQPRPVPPLKAGKAPVGVVQNRPILRQAPPKVVSHSRPSQLDNPQTRKNINDARNRQNVLKNNRNVRQAVNDRSRNYRRDRRPIIVQRSPRYRGYYNNPYYRYYYSRWYTHGFYGGYWYPVNPCYDIDLYYDYAMVYWMYADNSDADDANYYSNWYGDDEPIAPFAYAGVYYPTDTLRDLGEDVSGLPLDAQNNYRASLTNMTEDIQDAVSAELVSDFAFDQNDIVINHYQNLQDQAIVVEGFVDHGDLHVAFKGLLDLVDPSQTLTFVATSQQPADNDQSVLDQLNQRIVDLGGDPYSADQEPQTADPVDDGDLQSLN